jgi:hypothetical protein
MVTGRGADVGNPVVGSSVCAVADGDGEDDRDDDGEDDGEDDGALGEEDDPVDPEQAVTASAAPRARRRAAGPVTSRCSPTGQGRGKNCE